ncbi:MAG: hypothetical protein WC414_02830 [Patescibacteria group bacterium]
MPEKINNESILGDVLHEWSIPEYNENQRPKSWLIFMLLLAVLLIFYSIFTDNYLFILIITLFSIIIFLQSIQKPIILPFKITRLGISINNKFYKYGELRDFFIIYNPKEEVKMLFFETTGLKPRLRIPLVDEDPTQIRKTLLNFLEEDLKQEDEPLSDFIARKWKLH